MKQSVLQKGIDHTTLFGAILLLSALMLFTGILVMGAASDTVEFVVGEKTFMQQGTATMMDVATFTEGGRTFVPVRFLAQGLGIGSDGIGWDAARQMVTLRKGSATLTLVIGSKELKVNGKTVTMDTAPLIRDARTFLPARFVAEALGYTVGWVQSTQTVVITPAAAQTYTVEIRNFAFTPATLTIAKGDSVTWTNRDGASHSVLIGDVDSGLLKTGESYTRTFNEAGTFSYRCGPHPGMLGTLIVQ